MTVNEKPARYSFSKKDLFLEKIRLQSGFCSHGEPHDSGRGGNGETKEKKFFYGGKEEVGVILFQP